MSNPNSRAACERRTKVQPFSHYGALLPDPGGNVAGVITAVGMGGITEIATSAPGYNSLRPIPALRWRKFSS
jgi:hypothetical protein